MKRAGGAAQAVALLLAVLSSDSEPANLPNMRNCPNCGGPVLVCALCRHPHCDDETCPRYPIECAQEAAT